jgi:hypothetical protein
MNDALKQKVCLQVERDIKTIETFQKDLDTLEQVYLKTLNREFDKSKYKPGAVINNLLFQVYDLPLDQTAINLIDNATLDNSEDSRELIELSSMYKLYAKNINDVETIIYDRLTSNLSQIEKTQDWYLELITDFNCENDCLNYLSKNKDFKNQIASLRFLYNNLYGDLVNGF